MTDTSVKSKIEAMGQRARAAAHTLSQMSTEEKNRVILAVAGILEARTAQIIEANAADVADARKNGLAPAMVDRLKLDEKRVADIAAACVQVAKLADPVGEVLEEWTRPNAMKISQVRVPIGTIAIVFESRPNVTVDAAVLCFKTGNATILRGGSEALRTNLVLAQALCDAEGMPKDAVQLVPFTDREAVTALAKMDKWLDLIIPRGGKGLIERVVADSRVPVIKHYEGICHLYVDKSADLDMAVSLTVDAKTQKCSVCNAVETLLVHADVADAFLPMAAKALQAKNVELRGCDKCRAIVPSMVAATEQDWTTEYLSLVLSVRVVSSLQQAVEHINAYGSHHTDTIVAQDAAAADAFLSRVDSACVLHNVSTRFADGGEFGFGAEIGISTDKLHARGPMGLRELTSYKYKVCGSGQTKAPVKL